MGLTRSFIAIPILGREAAVLARAGRALRVGRPLAEENLHLTLAFLGDLGSEALGEVDEALSALRLTPFDLRFVGPGAPGSGAAPLVWCEVAPDPPLMALHTAVARAIRRAGLVPEARRFRPHVTIARLGRGGSGHPDLAAAAEVLAGMEPMRVAGISLMASDLRRDGARYEELASYPLFG